MNAIANSEAEAPRPRFELPCLFAILALALGLRLWGLEQNGWGAEYYTAAVKSMSLNWHNFFFAAFDPTGFISVDKPPLALWLQVASVKLFGFQPLAVLLPQVLEGVAAVAVLYHLVRRRFDGRSALLAALLLAVTPVWVAVNRTNNMDSCLLLVLLLAAWPLLAAAEQGSRRLLLLSAALVGLAFNVKMLAAYIVLPAFFLVYFIGAPLGVRRRLADLALAGAVVAATSLPWVLACEFTPPGQRPYIGSSSRNSMFELLVGHNGAGRFVSRVARAEPAEGQPEAAAEPTAAAAAEAPSAPRRIIGRLFVRTPTGPLRLLDGRMAAQAAWMLPLALAALVIGFARRRRRGSSAPADISLLFWFAWFAIYAAVYSYAGGIMHFYYLSTLAPPLAALAAIGAIALWDDCRQRRGWRAAGLPLLLLATAGWQLAVHAGGLGAETAAGAAPAWLGGLKAALLAGTLAAAAGVALLRAPRPAAAAAALGIAALLVLPGAWALSSVLLPGHGVMPSADLFRLIAHAQDPHAIQYARLGKAPEVGKLVDFLRSKRGSETYLLATSTTQLAAPIIIGSDAAVMARGGFHGLDAAVTPDSLQRLIAARQLRFVALGDVAPVSRKMGADRAGAAVSAWVQANGKPVPAALWRSSRSQRGVMLYDMRPDIPDI